jgi:hypothetical protein
LRGIHEYTGCEWSLKFELLRIWARATEQGRETGQPMGQWVTDVLSHRLGMQNSGRKRNVVVRDACSPAREWRMGRVEVLTREHGCLSRVS